MDTQTQIERLIDLAIIQRSELKKLVSELPQLREHLNAEIERVFEDAEPQLRTELEDWTTKQAKDQTAKLGGELEAKIAALSKSLEATTQTRYNAIMAERAQNIDLAKKAEDKLAEVAQAIPVQVKQIVTDELARFPRAGEIDQLRKEFAEPRGLNPRGRWQVGETYNKLDLVSYNGDSYVSNTDGNREKPSRSSEAWTLSAARGNGGAGGGVTSLTDLVAVPANGELLIGNGSAFVNNTITGGTGVTVTNGPGTITIDASGAQEILTATVTNAESVAITRGQVVYLFGATGNRASVKLANNATDAESSKTFGVVSEASIAAGANGLVTCVGTVDKLTLGSYTEGDVLYLGATPGSVTATKPYAPNHLVYVGIVERANNGNGELYVRIQNGFELDEIHDVQITSAPLAGSLLMRDATNSLWKANRLTGTANQVTVTNADTAVTLSLPTAIANVNSVTAATTQNLTLAGGSTGASLVLGQGANASTVFTGTGNGLLSFTKTTGNPTIRAIAPPGASGVFEAYTPSTSMLSVYGLFSVIEGNGNKWEHGFYGTLDYVHRYNSSEKLRFTTTGNLLIGTTTDSGNGKLQLATHTTSAGGIGFGTDTSLFRNATGRLTLGRNDATNAAYLRFAYNTSTSAVESGSIGAQNSVVYIDSLESGGSIQLRTNGATTALTLASNQAATFAGAVNVASTTSASSSTVGALTVGNGTAATNVAIGGGNIWAGGNARIGGNSLSSLDGGVGADFAVTSTSVANVAGFLQGSAGRGIQLYQNGYVASTTGGSWNVAATTAGATMTVATNGSASGGALSFASATSVNVLNTAPSTGAGSGALQVAGGIYSGANSYFGGSVSLVNASDSNMSLTRTGGVALALSSRASSAVVSSGGALVLESSYATALTLAATTGAATFAGAVTAPSATIKRASTSEDAFTNFYTGGSPYWTVGLQAVGTSNDFRIVNAQSGNRSLSISTTTEAATFAGTVIAPAATTAISSVRLPHGTAPTSPVNGDMWTTTAGLYVRINGVTVGPLS